MRDQRDMSGVVFKNSHKTKPEHPDYRGKCMLNGVQWDISGWIKQSINGNFLSLAFTPPRLTTTRPVREPGEDPDTGLDEPLRDH